MVQINTVKSQTERNKRELLIVDCGVADAGQLIDSLARPVDVVRLVEGKDPVLQIAAALSARFGTEILHIAAHAEPGVLLLAGQRVDSAYLCARRDALSTIKFALRENATLFLWSSKAACGLKGEAFTQVLAGCTGATVCAAKPFDPGCLLQESGADNVQQPGSGHSAAVSTLDLSRQGSSFRGKKQTMAKPNFVRPSGWESKIQPPPDLAKSTKTVATCDQ